MRAPPAVPRPGIPVQRVQLDAGETELQSGQTSTLYSYENGAVTLLLSPSIALWRCGLRRLAVQPPRRRRSPGAGGTTAHGSRACPRAAAPRTSSRPRTPGARRSRPPRLRWHGRQGATSSGRRGTLPGRAGHPPPRRHATAGRKGRPGAGRTQPPGNAPSCRPERAAVGAGKHSRR